MILFYHKPNCSTSIAALKILKKCLKKTKEPLTIVEYLKQVPTPEELKQILKKLNMKALQVVRKKEPLFKEEFEGKKISNAGWVKIICSNPVLLERPIVITDDKAIIARPPDRIIDFLNCDSSK